MEGKEDGGMKWDVIITTEKGSFSLGYLHHGYKTKREAERMAEQARKIEENLKVEIIKK
jgi:hypothetical protein